MNYHNRRIPPAFLWIFVLLTGLVGLIYWQGLLPGTEVGPGDNFREFRAKKLALPRRGEPLSPVTLGNITLPRGMGWSLTPGYKLVKERRLDLDGDGIVENYHLLDGRLTITEDPRILWESPGEWWVEDFFAGDSTNDGILNLNLLVWKQGSFGKSKPFWVKNDDSSVKNHLFIFKMVDGTLKPVWQSSNLDRPNQEASLVDLNKDGKNELLVIEGSYTDPHARRITIWQWNGWGFTLVESGPSVKDK